MLLIGRGDPDPGVDHLEADLPTVDARGGSHGTNDDVARARELDRVRCEVEQDLAEAHGIAAPFGPEPGLAVRHELESFPSCAVGDDGGDVVEQILEVELDLLERELARLDLGEVEDVVDDPEQALGRGGHALRELLLLVVELGVQQQGGEADDAVHRRPDLVAHVGEELRLHLRCRKRLVAGGGQVRAESLVLEDHRQVIDDADGEQPEGEPDQGAIDGLPARLAYADGQHHADEREAGKGEKEALAAGAGRLESFGSRRVPGGHGDDEEADEPPGIVGLHAVVAVQGGEAGEDAVGHGNRADAERERLDHHPRRALDAGQGEEQHRQNDDVEHRIREQHQMRDQGAVRLGEHRPQHQRPADTEDAARDHQTLDHGSQPRAVPRRAVQQQGHRHDEQHRRAQERHVFDRRGGRRVALAYLPPRPVDLAGTPERRPGREDQQHGTHRSVAPTRRRQARE